MYYKHVILFIQKYFIALPPCSKITFTDSYVSIMAFYSITYFRYCTVIILFAHKVILYTKKYYKLQLLRISILSKCIVNFFQKHVCKTFLTIIFRKCQWVFTSNLKIIKKTIANSCLNIKKKIIQHKCLILLNWYF